MELLGRGFIVLCLVLFATPLRSARLTVVGSPSALTPSPESDSQESTVGQKTAIDAPEAVMMREIVSATTNVSGDDVISSLRSEDHAEKEDERAFNQTSAHSRSQLESEPDLPSTVVQDGKAKTEHTQRALSEDLGDSIRNVAKVGSDAAPTPEAGHTTTAHASKDGVIKSLPAEEATGKHDKRSFKQAGVHTRSHTKSVFNKPSTVTTNSKGSPVHISSSKLFLSLEVFSIFAFMGVLGYLFSMCL